MKSIMSHSSKSLILFSVCLLGSLGAFAEVCQAQRFQYPPYGAQRGRMVARDGIGHSVRYRWGNGLTPTGGAVITSAIDAFAPAVIALAGRDLEGEARSREAEARSREAARSRAKMCDRLAAAQEEANALLVRTVRLVDEDFALTTPPPRPEPPERDDTDLGSDPWPDVPFNAGSQPAADNRPPPPPVMGDDPWKDVQENPANG